MGTEAAMSDAWDDDWEAQADRVAAEEPDRDGALLPTPKLSKAERLAQHAEKNRRVWESAESQETLPFFVGTQNSFPISAGTTSYSKTPTVLSRKPAPAPRIAIAKKSDRTSIGQASAAAVSALGQLSLGESAERRGRRVEKGDDEDEDEGEDEDGDEDGDEDVEKQEKPKGAAVAAEEMRERQLEKRRRYEEARAKIFGSPLPSETAGRTPGPGSRSGSQTPPGGGGLRGRGRGRGRQQQDRRSGERQARQRSPQRGGGGELYDPDYARKPEILTQKRREESGTPGRQQQQPVREPRGPGKGRGFAASGGP